jgi:hypothetical protein
VGRDRSSGEEKHLPLSTMGSALSTDHNGIGVTLQNCIREMFDSNLGQVTGYPEVLAVPEHQDGIVAVANYASTT